MDQKRFLLALVLSAVILFGWSYLFPAPAPPQDNQNTAPTQTAGQQTTPAPQTPSAPAQTPQEAAPSTSPAQDDVQRRTLTVESPLYSVQLDSRGAVATSWVIKKRKRLDALDREDDLFLFSSAGGRQNPRPLELVSRKSLEGGEAPLRVETGDKNLDAFLSSKNHAVSGAEEGADRIELNPGDSPRRLDFVARDPSTGTEVVKSLTFHPESYAVDFSVKVSSKGQQPANVRLAVGPDIGDQGVPHYTFYSVAPEGVYAPPNGDTERVYASDVNGNEQSPGRVGVPGSINWAAVGDTYFAMVAVPSKPTEGLEYRTSKYEHEADGNKEERFLITGFVPVPADGSVSQLYVGPKDHYLLEDASAAISRAVPGRAIDLDGLIDYGWGSRITRPLATPILWSIRRLNALTGNYGVAIILFTIIFYSIFFPLKWRSTKSMKKAQKLAPRMKELQEKIKGLQSKAKGAKQNEAELKELQMEQLRLMKEGNPLGGCLPLLAQMPFLFALFRAITISLDFRQASFLWMPDLSAADPYRLLPFLMAGSMLVIQWVTPAPAADPLQRKMMAVMLPVMMLYMMWSAPAGLLVYWFVGNVVTFGQQLIINRMVKSEDDQEPPEKKGSEKVNPKRLDRARMSQA